MKKVFLSFSFRDEDRALNSQVERLVDSHNLMGVTGVRAGGQPLRDRIFQQIEGCDALVALMTRRDKIAGQQAWTTSEWVKNELNHGRAKKLRTIALVENGVQGYTFEQCFDDYRLAMLSNLIRTVSMIGGRLDPIHQPRFLDIFLPRIYAAVIDLNAIELLPE